MNSEFLQNKIESTLPGSKAQIMDTTGTGDHFKAVVIADVFQGKSTLQRHKMIFDLFPEELKSGELHALELKTFTHEEFKNY